MTLNYYYNPEKSSFFLNPENVLNSENSDSDKKRIKNSSYHQLSHHEKYPEVQD